MRPPAQRGRPSRLTAAAIAEIRDAYDAVRVAREWRAEVMRRYGIDPTEFSRYGTGAQGKKPAEAA